MREQVIIWSLLLVIGAVSFCDGAPPIDFDWRDQVELPPVRNQGACGSCWAVCAIDVMESALIIQQGVTVDLSEQWLVDCTQGGDGCGGGVSAYGLNSLLCTGSNYPDDCGHSGAVLEADLPYTGTDTGDCGCPYGHHYCLESSGWVGGTMTPSNLQIMEAVYNYGPVACHMDVYTDLYDYSDGVYTHLYGSSYGSKAMVIVGWDTGKTSYWIVKNTWGKSWGESGYMRVAFDACNIGNYACYAGTVVEMNHWCGEPGQIYLAGDVNEDCHVNLRDLAMMAADWLKCTDLSDAACSWD